MEKKHSALGPTDHPRTLHLHIGIPKTASTWLQTKVFTSLDHLRYLGCPSSNLFDLPEDRQDRRLMASVFKRSSHIWNGFGDAIFQELVGDRQAWLAEGRDLLISEEGIGRQGSRPALLGAHINEMRREAINWGFERVNIICVIRRQDHWLASHYAQMSNRNPRAGQAGFEQLVREVTSPRLSRYGFGMLLDFSTLYDYLNEIVGADNLLLLPYELLNASPKAFLQPLLASLNTPAEKIDEIYRSSAGTVANVRSEQSVWHLRPKRARQIAGLTLPSWNIRAREKTIALTADIEREVHKAYSQGNRQLAAKTNLELRPYGYLASG